MNGISLLSPVYFKLFLSDAFPYKGRGSSWVPIVSVSISWYHLISKNWISKLMDKDISIIQFFFSFTWLEPKITLNKSY